MGQRSLGLELQQSRADKAPAACSIYSGRKRRTHSWQANPEFQVRQWLRRYGWRSGRNWRAAVHEYVTDARSVGRSTHGELENRSALKCSDRGMVGWRGEPLLRAGVRLRVVKRSRWARTRRARQLKPEDAALLGIGASVLQIVLGTHQLRSPRARMRQCPRLRRPTSRSKSVGTTHGQISAELARYRWCRAGRRIEDALRD